jgi:hypothetical protein
LEGYDKQNHTEHLYQEQEALVPPRSLPSEPASISDEAFHIADRLYQVLRAHSSEFFASCMRRTLERRGLDLAALWTRQEPQKRRLLAKDVIELEAWIVNLSHEIRVRFVVKRVNGVT